MSNAKSRYREKTRQINVHFSLSNQDLYGFLEEIYSDDNGKVSGASILQALRERKELSDKGM